MVWVKNRYMKWFAQVVEPRTEIRGPWWATSDHTRFLQYASCLSSPECSHLSPQQAVLLARRPACERSRLRGAVLQQQLLLLLLAESKPCTTMTDF